MSCDNDNLHKKGYVKAGYDNDCKGDIAVVTEYVLDGCIAGNVCYDKGYGEGHSAGVIAGTDAALVGTLADCNSGNACYDLGFTAGVNSMGACTSGNGCYDTGYAAGLAAGSPVTNIAGTPDYTTQNAVFTAASGWSAPFNITDDNVKAVLRYVGPSNSAAAAPDFGRFRKDGFDQSGLWENKAVNSLWTLDDHQYVGDFDATQNKAGILGVLGSGTKVIYTGDKARLTDTNGGATTTDFDNYFQEVLGTISITAEQISANTTQLLRDTMVPFITTAIGGTGVGTAVVICSTPSGLVGMTAVALAAALQSIVEDIYAAKPATTIVLMIPDVPTAYQATVTQAYKIIAKDENLYLVNASTAYHPAAHGLGAFYESGGNRYSPKGRRRLINHLLDQVSDPTIRTTLLLPAAEQATPKRNLLAQGYSTMGGQSTAYGFIRPNAYFDASGAIQADSSMRSIDFSINAVSAEYTLITDGTNREVMYLNGSTVLGVMNITDRQASGHDNIVTPVAYLATVTKVVMNYGKLSDPIAERNLALANSTHFSFYRMYDALLYEGIHLTPTSHTNTTDDWSTRAFRVGDGMHLALENNPGNIEQVNFYNNAGVIVNISAFSVVAGESYLDITVPSGLGINMMSIQVSDTNDPNKATHTLATFEDLEIYPLSGANSFSNYDVNLGLPIRLKESS